MISFKDIFKSSFLENVNAVTLPDMAIALVLAFLVGLFIFFVYKKTYSGIAAYLERAIEDAKEKGYAETLFGRRRPLPELKASNRVQRAFGERVAMNAPIQGTAADIIKIAMVRVYRRLKTEVPAARLILQVHDELIVETPQGSAEQVRELVRQEMESAVSLSVPLLVDAKVGKTWGEAH